MPKSADGFTLIELLVVITVFAVVTAGFIPYVLRISAERQLESVGNDLLSKMQLQQTDALQGVNGNWYGVHVDKNADKKLVLYEVNEPNTCLITKRELAIESCNVTKEEYSNLDNFDLNLSITQVENGIPNGINTGKLDIRFNRGPRGNEVAIVSDTYSPLVTRARIELSVGDKKRIIVVDGGNICTPESYNQASPPCQRVTSSGSPIFGGPKIGRIFLVEG